MANNKNNPEDLPVPSSREFTSKAMGKNVAHWGESAIWFDKSLTLPRLNPLGPKTMGEYLGMEWVELGADYLIMRMPVDDRTKQPYGLLHGGASCALAESIGSLASHFVIDPDKFICVGLEINANHVRSARNGYVTATCMPLHIGASTHVWDIKIHDDRKKLVCVSRLTVAILKKPQVGSKK